MQAKGGKQMFGRSWGRLEAELARTLHETFALVADRLRGTAPRTPPPSVTCPRHAGHWILSLGATCQCKQIVKAGPE